MSGQAVFVRFHRVIQNLHGIETDANGNYMTSELRFDVVAEGRVWSDLSCTIRQAAGSTGTADRDYLEVTLPASYDGPMNHAAFTECATRYFRSLIGAGGSGIRIEGSTNIVMRGNTIVSPMECEFETTD